VPVAVRANAQGGRRLDRLVTVVGGGFTALLVAWTAVLLLLPTGVGEALMGESWTAARDTVPAMAVNVATTGLVAAYVVGLRGLADARASLRGRTWASVSKVALAVVGAMVWGGTGGAWGLAIGGVIGVALLRQEYRRSWVTAPLAPPVAVPAPPGP
jgi:O-antigen/teichoic acid export membrane protein